MKNVLAKQKTEQTEIAVEFLRITATSALLQELLGGKLAATIRAFCRRAAADARAQKPDPAKKNNKTEMEAASSSGAETKNGASGASMETMTAAQNRQAMKENEVQRMDLNKDVSLSQQVYTTESEVAEELRQLCAMGVFPKAELQTIRETYNELDRERIRLLATKNENDNEEELKGEFLRISQSTSGTSGTSGMGSIRTEGELELEFCKRKLAILRGRRQELELNISKGIDIGGHASTGQGRMLEESGGGGDMNAMNTMNVRQGIVAPPTTLVTHANMSPHERAIVTAAAREVEIVAEQGAQQQSIARARLSDARKFSKNHYSSKSSATVQELNQTMKSHSGVGQTSRKTTKSTKNKVKMSTTSAYLGEFEVCLLFLHSLFLL